MTSEFPHLFDTGRIGPLELRNRLVMAPMGTNYATASGEVTDRLLDYYAERAAGGTGLVTVGTAAVEYPRGRAIVNQLSIADDSRVPGLSKLARRIKQHGANAFVQLHHAGGGTTVKKTGGVQPIVCSSVENAYNARDPRVLETDAVESTVERFVDAAKRARKAGFDGVELHGSHGYLIQEFLSPRNNRRDDRYGGDLDARMRFPTEIVEGIRDAVGDDLALSFRLSADEFVDGGYGLEEATRMAEQLAAAGVDAFSVTVGAYGVPTRVLEPMSFEEAWRSQYAATIAEAVDVPTITVGVIRQPETAETVLADGDADFVAVGRGHIADPHFARKAREGRVAEINRCIGCNIGCIGEGIFADRELGCTVNPTVGREREFATLEPAPERQRVLVVGAGPAGLQVAIRSADRGHDVTLYDAAEEVGGQLHLAAAPPGKGKNGWYLEYLEHQLERRPVDVRLGARVDRATVEAADPDAVVVATGASPRGISVPGADGSHVVQSWDVIDGSVSVDDESVVVVGGGDVGCDTAGFLADQGCEVTVIEQTDRIAPDKERISRIDVLQTLESNDNVALVTGETVLSIEEESVTTVRPDGSEAAYEADRVVLAVGHEPNDGLADELEEYPAPVYVVGDARESRDIYRATLDGTEAGISIGDPYRTFSPQP
jgi:2,4-dienoyl-CoA reductase-like NADH-dependent reductase (Old Yellow Enzyme family)/NADPH-dependent 2,4-dienoyl-CoA reductase/sulfur reductase-like enzyme